MISSSISKLHSQKRHRKLELVFQMSTIIAGIPTLIFLLIFSFIGPNVIDFFFGDSYKSGVIVINVLGLGYTINVIMGSPATMLLMKGNEYKFIKFSLSAGLMGIIIGFLLIPKYGILGAAIGSAIAVSVSNLSMWRYCKLNLGINTRFKITALNSLFLFAIQTIEKNLVSKGWRGLIARIYRIIEELTWNILRKKIVDCFGDSHAKIFRCINNQKELSDYRFRVVSTVDNVFWQS